MEIKWIILAMIAVAVLSIYVRAMRTHAHASWSEVLSFGHNFRSQKKDDGKAPAPEV
jgi:hypothetical protein